MNKSICRLACGVVAFAGVCFGGLKIYKAIDARIEMRTDGFNIQAISSNRQPNPAWDVHPLNEEEKAELTFALGQKYHYLARGNQAFAFLSEDGRYVLKFFKQKLFEPHFFWRWIPSLWLKEGRRAKKIWKKHDKLHRDFESYRIAFDELKTETGLVFVHLNPTDWIGQAVIVSDKAGEEHTLALDRLNFIVQRRADLVYPTLDRLMAEGNIVAAKEALSSILHLFVTRCNKGIADSDPDLDKNFGFIEGQAIQIDIGRFTHQLKKVKFKERHAAHLPQSAKVEIPPIKESFTTWLSENYPVLYQHFDTEYQALVAQ